MCYTNDMQRGGRHSGFTIIELLLVVLVIAILTTIVVVAYNSITKRSYVARASSELTAISRGVQLYKVYNKQYPDDVDRNIPVAVFEFTDSPAASYWPTAPWPGSVYDYDKFVGSDGNEVVQVSVRFCPISGPLSACKFPKEPWAANFDLQSSAYWCIKGKCRAHPTAPDNHPGYCLNCKDT